MTLNDLKAVSVVRNLFESNIVECIASPSHYEVIISEYGIVTVMQSKDY